MKKKLIVKRHIRILIFCLLYFSLYSCAPKLTFTEIEERINKDYTAFNEGNVEYELKNTPRQYLKEYGENGFRKELHKIYDNRKNYPYFSDIGELAIQDRNKCNRTYFYKVKYTIDKVQMTPYLDSTALKLNQKEYGKENVNFNPNSKILQVREKKEQILILDKDREWKLLDYGSEMQYLNRYFGEGFSDCIQTKVDNSDYLPYY